MPWCPACERSLSAPTVTPDGRCPHCRGEVETGRSRVAVPESPAVPGGAAAGGAEGEDLGPLPWHLKILGGATVVYLGWRLVQGIAWVVNRV